jgi:hypothetical protein
MFKNKVFKDESMFQVNQVYLYRLISVFILFTVSALFLFSNLHDVNAQNTSVVICGNGRDVTKACKIDDLFKTLNQFAGVLIKVVFPAVFFFGLFMTVTPILWSADKPEALALAKSRFKYVAIGTGVVLGAYLIVKVVLTSLGFKESDTVQPTFGNYINIFVNTAYAADADCTSSICNPLSIGSVQDVIRNITNTVGFLAIVGSVIAIVRGVIFLMLSQENPDFVKRGKKWIIGGLGVAALFLGGEMIYNLIVNTAKSVAG